MWQNTYFLLSSLLDLPSFRTLLIPVFKNYNLLIRHQNSKSLFIIFWSIFFTFSAIHFNVYWDNFCLLEKGRSTFIQNSSQLELNNDKTIIVDRRCKNINHICKLLNFLISYQNHKVCKDVFSPYLLHITLYIDFRIKPQNNEHTA